MKRVIGIACLLLLGLYSCRKDDTETVFSLPEKSQSGRKTFGFLLNTSVWVNFGQVCFPFAGGCRENLSGIYNTSNGAIQIFADKVIHENGSWKTIETIELNLATKLQGTKTYSTLHQDEMSVGYSYSEKGQLQKSYFLPAGNPSFTLTVTKIDTVRGILSGEFSGKLFRRLSDTTFNTSLTDSIILRDGRFDLQLK
jgi:hypothetical protein